jgi:hypothetical protein
MEGNVLVPAGALQDEQRNDNVGGISQTNP